MNSTLKNLIEAAVVKEFEALFESFRNFSLEQLKQMESPVEMKEYASKHLPYLGSGGARTVFGWKAGKVIKIAQWAYNTLQNQKEIEQYFNNHQLQPFLAKIYDFDKDRHLWLVSEGVQVIADNVQLRNKFTVSELVLVGIIHGALDNIPFKKALETAINEHNERYDWVGSQFVEQKPITLDELNSLDLELFENVYKLTKMGVTDVDRYDHWGMTSTGRVVLVDYGLSV